MKALMRAPSSSCPDGLKVLSTNTARSPRRIGSVMTKHRIYTTSFASVYPLYVAKAERKGREKTEVDHIVCWLTGFSPAELEAQLAKKSDFETFFAQAPQLNPARSMIKGAVCGVRVEDVAEPLMREIRYLDKLIDELAKGKAMQKILRQSRPGRRTRKSPEGSLKA
jgi:hypothetical protein